MGHSCQQQTDISPLVCYHPGGHACIQIYPLRGNSGNGDTGEGRRPAGSVLVPSLHIPLHLFDEGWVIGLLLGSGLPTHIHACRTLALPQEADTLPHQDSDNPDGLNRLFAYICGDITNPTRRDRLLQAWISPETWRLINTRIATL